MQSYELTRLGFLCLIPFFLLLLNSRASQTHSRSLSQSLTQHLTISNVGSRARRAQRHYCCRSPSCRSRSSSLCMSSSSVCCWSSFPSALHTPSP